YATRQKRADTKKALKDLLFSGGSPKVTFEDEFHKTNHTRNWAADPVNHSDSADTK
ncbi:unnamed protein product, partial [Ilex paraguariensis]